MRMKKQKQAVAEQITIKNFRLVSQSFLRK